MRLVRDGKVLADSPKAQNIRFWGNLSSRKIRSFRNLLEQNDTVHGFFSHL